MNGFLLIRSGFTSDLPVLVLPSLKSAIHHAKECGTEDIANGAAPVNPILARAVRACGRPSVQCEGWKIIEFVDGYPVQTTMYGWDQDVFPDGWQTEYVKPPLIVTDAPKPLISVSTRVSSAAALDAALAKIVRPVFRATHPPAAVELQEVFPGMTPEMGGES